MGVDRKEKEEQSQMMIQESAEVDKEERAEPPGAPYRRTAVKFEPKAATTQEAVDGYRAGEDNPIFLEKCRCVKRLGGT